ncbi:hypothetical protein SPHINGOR109_20177 [Sphingorhabdus sp. 109]|nr:hypothetical protein SPHINGOR109_20177 [Sphingorhabdus sp. 109]
MAENPAIPPTDARRLATILLRGKTALGIIFAESRTGRFPPLSLSLTIIFWL